MGIPSDGIFYGPSVAGLLTRCRYNPPCMRFLFPVFCGFLLALAGCEKRNQSAEVSTPPPAARPSAAQPAAGQPSATEPGVGQPTAGQPPAGRPAAAHPAAPRLDNPPAPGRAPSREMDQQPVRRAVSLRAGTPVRIRLGS